MVALPPKPFPLAPEERRCTVKSSNLIRGASQPFDVLHRPHPRRHSEDHPHPPQATPASASTVSFDQHAKPRARSAAAVAPVAAGVAPRHRTSSPLLICVNGRVVDVAQFSRVADTGPELLRLAAGQAWTTRTWRRFFAPVMSVPLWLPEAGCLCGVQFEFLTNPRSALRIPTARPIMPLSSRSHSDLGTSHSPRSTTSVLPLASVVQSLWQAAWELADVTAKARARFQLALRTSYMSGTGAQLTQSVSAFGRGHLRPLSTRGSVGGVSGNSSGCQRESPPAMDVSPRATAQVPSPPVDSDVWHAAAGHGSKHHAHATSQAHPHGVMHRRLGLSVHLRFLTEWIPTLASAVQHAADAADTACHGRSALLPRPSEPWNASPNVTPPPGAVAQGSVDQGQGQGADAHATHPRDEDGGSGAPQPGEKHLAGANGCPPGALRRTSDKVGATAEQPLHSSRSPRTTVPTPALQRSVSATLARALRHTATSTASKRVLAGMAPLIQHKHPHRHRVVPGMHPEPLLRAANKLLERYHRRVVRLLEVLEEIAASIDQQVVSGMQQGEDASTVDGEAAAGPVSRATGVSARRSSGRHATLAAQANGRGGVLQSTLGSDANAHAVWGSRSASGLGSAESAVATALVAGAVESMQAYLLSMVDSTDSYFQTLRPMFERYGDWRCCSTVIGTAVDPL